MRVHDEPTIENRLRNVSLNFVLNKDPQRWWKGELAWARHGACYFYGIPASEIDGAAPVDADHRMSTPIARIALNQLKKLDYYNERRRANASRWIEWCRDNEFIAPLEVMQSTPTYLGFPVLVRPEMKRDLRWAYRSLGVVPGTGSTPTSIPRPSGSISCRTRPPRSIAASISQPCFTRIAGDGADPGG